VGSRGMVGVTPESRRRPYSFDLARVRHPEWNKRYVLRDAWHARTDEGLDDMNKWNERATGYKDM
jgi:hypothetical protein